MAAHSVVVSWWHWLFKCPAQSWAQTETKTIVLNFLEGTWNARYFYYYQLLRETLKCSLWPRNGRDLLMSGLEQLVYLFDSQPGSWLQPLNGISCVERNNIYAHTGMYTHIHVYIHAMHIQLHIYISTGVNTPTSCLFLFSTTDRVPDNQNHSLFLIWRWCGITGAGPLTNELGGSVSKFNSDGNLLG